MFYKQKRGKKFYIASMSTNEEVELLKGMKKEKGA